MKNVLVYVGYKTLNYGSVLQAFATMEMLKKIGVEPVLLNLNGLWKEIKSKKIKFYLFGGDFFFFVQSKGKMYWSKAYEKMNPAYGVLIERRRKQFDDFIQKRCILSDEVSTFSEASVLAEQYEAVLLGSDQVWLPSSVVTDIYTLDFVRNERITKIAYAPSFGIENIPEKYAQKYRKMMRSIDYISVREESGKKIVKQISGIDCTVAADPVLMLDRNEWEKCLSDMESAGRDYIFVYLIGNNKWQREWIKRYAAKCNMKTVALIHLDEYISYDESFFDEVLVDESPVVFFNLVRNAKSVFTDSYHCMIFSLIENKNVWCFRRFDDAKTISTNSRLYTILLKLKIEERLLNRKSRIEDCLFKKIDYADVNERIKNLQNESWLFLKNALGCG